MSDSPYQDTSSGRKKLANGLRTSLQLTELHPLPENENYDIKWSSDVRQITKELIGFRTGIEGFQYRGFQSAFFHGINVVRMLWPDFIELEKKYIHPDTGELHVIQNWVFLKIFKTLCEHESVGLTGAASTGKTFCASVFNNVLFYAAPNKTTCLLSTTSGSASERRIWADIKELHRRARFFDNGIPEIGSIVEYLKALTFDKSATSKNNQASKIQRDLRNGVIVVPIPNDSKGEAALNTIMGTKNSIVSWTIDELPAMMDDVWRPKSNLTANPTKRFIGIGNANRPSDPHGVMMEPINGWGAIDRDVDEEWYSGTCYSLFLHGEKTPNYDTRVKQDVDNVRQYPFPYLSNQVYNDAIARQNGNGSIERGRDTIDYLRFAIGFWYGEDAENTVLSEALIREFNADAAPRPFDFQSTECFAALDPGWTSGGDACGFIAAECGSTIDRTNQIVIKADEEIRVKADASGTESREEFRKALAKEVVDRCIKLNVRPRRFAIDGSGDGGLVAQAIIREWSNHVGLEATEIVILSSLEPSTNDRFKDRVTQYWFSVRDVIASGHVRGFKIHSEYAKDLFKRQYISVGQGKVAVERKKDMKKRIRRSPDNGDAASYLFHLLVTSGHATAENSSRKLRRKAQQDMIRTTEERSPWQTDYASSADVELI